MQCFVHAIFISMYTTTVLKKGEARYKKSMAAY